MNKWLFTEEYVGEKMWKNKDLIAELYFKLETDPFIEKNSSCGYSKADFDIMCDSLKRIGVLK